MKHFLKKDRPFGVSQVKNYTVPGDVGDIHNIVSIGRITLPKTAKEAMSAVKAERQEDVHNNESNTSNGEYVVERIVRHKDRHQGAKYVVQKYGYKTVVDTWELPHHVS